MVLREEERVLKRGSFGVRAVAPWCGLLALVVSMARPAAAQAQGTKRVLLYTGTTGFRHTDGINGGRPVVQAALTTAGFTVDSEDCTNNGGAANNCDNAEKNPRDLQRRGTSPATTRRRLNSSAGTSAALVARRAEGVDHQVRPERRRYRRRPQRDGHGHHG